MKLLFFRWHDAFRRFSAPFQERFAVARHWQVDGTHYQKTAEAWLTNLDANRELVLNIMRTVYGDDQAKLWLQRWRIFFMACAELWGYADGKEWLVSHYPLKPKDSR